MPYNSKFLNFHEVALPELSDQSFNSVSTKSNLQLSDLFLNYSNYGLLLNPIRKFPFYTACNINGKLFKKISRKDIFDGSEDWQKDDRIPFDIQFGPELYDAYKSEFHRGHMTKREDVQWGENIELAKRAAQSTFYYTNSVPQMEKLNIGIWKSLEYYILHTETVKKEKKICLFTGPILLQNDPYFVTEINNKKIQLPFLFWKVVYFLKEKELFRTGFLVSQHKEMEEEGVIDSTYRDESYPDNSFNIFKSAETYQVSIETIEKLSGISFCEANESFLDERPIKLVVEEVDFRDEECTNLIEMEEIKKFEVKNLRL